MKAPQLQVRVLRSAMTLHNIRTALQADSPTEATHLPLHQINSPANFHDIFLYSYLIFIYLYVCVDEQLCVCEFYANIVFAVRTLSCDYFPLVTPWRALHGTFPSTSTFALSVCCFSDACALMWDPWTVCVLCNFLLHQQFMCYLYGWMHK